MKLQSILAKEIESYGSIEPNVLIFADSSAAYWVTKEGFYVWLQDHSGIGDFINETHVDEKRRYTDRNVEGVGNSGVYWNNQDFQAPFHISDFEVRINQINSLV